MCAASVLRSLAYSPVDRGGTTLLTVVEIPAPCWRKASRFIVDAPVVEILDSVENDALGWFQYRLTLTTTAQTCTTAHKMPSMPTRPFPSRRDMFTEANALPAKKNPPTARGR